LKESKGDEFMKIRNLKTRVIGPALLSLPMMCMHLGDGHHSGDHHSSTSQSSYQSSAYFQVAEALVDQGWMISHQDSADEK
jgi:hypothetical protein